jgi:hypothetical protein
MKIFASELAAAGKPLDEDELVWYLIHGLDPRHYNALIKYVQGNSSTTCQDLYNLLEAYDQRNAPDGPRDGPHRDRRDDNGRRRGRAPTPFVDVTCQICTIHEHPAKACWWRYQDDNEDDGGRDQKGAHSASYGIDTNWYSDTGATDHISGELSKLTTHDKYKGQDRVHTADGNGMFIRHIGHSTLHTPT